MSIVDKQKIQSYIDQGKLPPVELWDPPLCGHSEMLIQKNGAWLHQGKPFARQALVKLFASILKKESDEYFLVTPVEKLTIDVNFTPFVIVDCQKHGEDIRLTSNLGESMILDKSHNLYKKESAQMTAICTNVRRNLEAAFNSSSLQQLLEMAVLEADDRTMIYSRDISIDLNSLV
jgi:uncharacterized protein